MVARRQVVRLYRRWSQPGRSVQISRRLPRRRRELRRYSVSGNGTGRKLQLTNDVSNMYQDGQAEEIVGAWMAARECRDEIVLTAFVLLHSSIVCTDGLVRKYTYCYHPKAAYSRGQLNFQGNNAKSLYLSFESSLKRLQTSYIGKHISTAPQKPADDPKISFTSTSGTTRPRSLR